MGRDESAATSPNPSFLLPRSHSHFGSHPSLIAGKTTPLFSYTCVEPILQPFCFQIHACNGGGCPPSSGSRLPIPYPLSPACPQQSRGIPFLFTFLRNLLHFFALAQISTLFFSSDSALFAKNHPGWGAICRFCDRWRAASQRAGANLPHSVNRSLKIKRAATRAAPSKISRELLRASALLLFFGRLLCRWGSRRLCRRRWSLRRSGHAVLEAANALSKSLHDFRDALAAKENQYDRQNHKPMENTKFTHEPPPRAPCGSAL